MTRAVIAHPGIGGERQIGQHQTGQVAVAVVVGAVQAALGGVAGEAVGGELDAGVEVGLGAVELAPDPHPRRGQRFELAADAARGGGEVVRQRTGRRCTRDHRLQATVVGLQDLLLVVPLRQQDALPKRHVVL